MPGDNLVAKKLTGSFLVGDADVIDELQRAAATQFSKSAKALFDLPEASPQEIVSILGNEQATANGFWRIALVCLFAAKQQKIPLPEAPAEVKVKQDALLEVALTVVPELFAREDFLMHCMTLMQHVEASVKSKSADKEGPKGVKSVPRRIMRSGVLPSSRYSNDGKVFACVNFTLSDERNEPILADEFDVEDMIFVAESALSGARSALGIAAETVKDGLLIRQSDQEVLTDRVESIQADLESLIEVLLTLPQASSEN
jgi:hypothetical protein